VLALADDEDINSPIIQAYLKEAQDNVRDRSTPEAGPNIGFSVRAAVNGISMVRPLVQPEVTPHELKLSVQLSPPPLKAPSPSTTGNVENSNSAVGPLLGYIN
jgi:hypothetical protein